MNINKFTLNIRIQIAYDVKKIIKHCSKGLKEILTNCIVTFHRFVKTCHVRSDPNNQPSVGCYGSSWLDRRFLSKSRCPRLLDMDRKKEASICDK